MEALPYHAMLVSEPYDHASSMKGAYALCTHCSEELTPPEFFWVGVPSNMIDGKPTIPTHQMVCSEACALAWLRSYTPAWHKTHKRAQPLVMPSTVEKQGWIYAYSTKDTYPIDHPLRSGKWLVFLSGAIIDTYWQRIGSAVLAGKMGECAKVSSAGSAKGRGGRHVICVYTYDYEDKADVMRIREELRACGILRPISYKRDLDTALLRYNNDYTPIYRA